MKNFIAVVLGVLLICSLGSFSMDKKGNSNARPKTEQSGKKDIKSHVKQRKTHSKKSIHKPKTNKKIKKKQKAKSNHPVANILK